jgi:DNA-binding NtrC family response regulator
MKGKILIVEDEFIVASDLRIILEKAGYEIAGIASSVTRALEIINLKKPVLVFLDIQLVGKLTGIDLARELAKMEIPFIYVSANSNQSILEQAKATRPYGFLVKPFRERDVLVTLDIALYKRENNLEAKLFKENALQENVSAIIESAENWEFKLLTIVKEFQKCFQFDYLSICWENEGKEFDNGLIFLKYNDSFELLNVKELVDRTGKTAPELKEALVSQDAVNKATFYIGESFEKMCAENPFRKIISRSFDMGSALIIPVFIPGKGILTYSFYSHENHTYKHEDTVLLDRLAILLMRIAKGIPRVKEISYSEANSSLKATLETADSHNDLQDEIHGLVGSGTAFNEVKKQVNIVAPFEISVLILGESGTGKERVAQAIHRLSGRKSQPLIKVNCAAIPASLMESELFGHEKGAFTGAMNRRIGKFEQAAGGTIFLDEIGELPLDLQVKLLCVLQEKEIVRLGSNQTIKTDVRIIAATNRNLEKEVAEGRFRLDLYYRLNVFPMLLPPLRDRKEDIPQLAGYFLKKITKNMGKSIRSISDEVIAALQQYDWPGNIRELENLMERGILLTSGDLIEFIDIPENSLPASPHNTNEGQIKTIKELEKDHILNVLKQCNGKIGGNGGAAELLDVAPTTLISKMNKLGIVKKFKI